VPAVGSNALVRGADLDTEVLGDALRYIDRQIGLASARLVAVAGKFLEGDRGQRQFVGDERVVRRERCREKTLARESMRLGNAGYCDAECDERRTVNGCRLQLLPPVTIECGDGMRRANALEEAGYADGRRRRISGESRDRKRRRARRRKMCDDLRGR